ncbi:GNAT family N-acetyltransferase [Candidatus Woesearchaeota archaeon]|nr:GNAT family N-acetyltransferase [Candidatus Woesearchaeota archaeon]
MKIKRVTNRGDLLGHLKARYSAYTFNNYLKKNTDGLDIDIYDFFSEHLVVVENNMVIGTMRMITTNKRTALQKELEDIVWRTSDSCFDKIKYALYKNRLEEIRVNLLPTLAYFDLLSNIKSLGYRIEETVEFSRNSVHPEYRGNGVSRTSLTAIYALARNYNPKCVIGSCKQGEEPFYKKHGYSVIDHDIKPNPMNGVPSVALILDFKNLPREINEKVDRIKFDREIEFI